MATKPNLSDLIRLSNAEKNVYLLLSYKIAEQSMMSGKHSNLLDISYQVNEFIAQQTGMHDVTRRAAISALVKAGFIEKTNHRGTYRINGFDWSVSDHSVQEPKTRKEREPKQSNNL